MTGAEALPPLLRAVDVGLMIDVDGTPRPTVHVDVADHPAIADLARVHAVEGIGDVRTRAQRLDDQTPVQLLLGVALHSPVRAAFAIEFVLPDHETFLLDVADAGLLTLATTDPHEAEIERPLWLAVTIDGPALRAVVTAGSER